MFSSPAGPDSSAPTSRICSPSPATSRSPSTGSCPPLTARTTTTRTTTVRTTPVRTGWSAVTSPTTRWSGTCCPGWTPSATRRRSWGTGSTPPTCRPTPSTTTTAPRCCWPPCTKRACRGWCWPRRWSSTARAGTCARNTATSNPRPGPARTWRRASTTRGAPGAGESRSPGRSVRTPRSARAASTRPPSWRRNTWRRRGRGRPAAPCGHCGTTTSTGPGCRRTPRTPGSPRCSGRRCAGARRPRCWRTGASAGTSCTSPTSPGRTCSPCAPRPTRAR